jgi:Ribonuclease G/E
MSQDFYNDIILRLKNLSNSFESNSIIIEEYFRRLERDAKNTLNGDTKTNFMKKIKEIKFGLVEPKKTFIEFIKENKDTVRRTAFDLIKEDINKIIIKREEITKNILKEMNSVMTRMDNFFKQNHDTVMKSNLAKRFYYIMDNKMKKSVPFEKMVPIMKWSLNKLNESKK